MRTIRIIVVSFLFLNVCTSVLSSESSFYFLKAKNAAKSGQIDFAFMNYKYVLRANPLQSERENALFAIGEYYYLITHYREAINYFSEYIKQFPESEGKLFALVYLKKIAEMENDKKFSSEMDKEILTFKNHGYIFKNIKEIVYISPLSRQHKAVYKIDEINFYVKGEKFEKILY